MIRDCEWFNSKIEGYFCETLNPEEHEAASDHLKSCLNCRTEVQGMRAIDPLMKQLLEFRMANSRAPVARGKVSWSRLTLAGATLSMAALLMIALLSHKTPAIESTGSQPQVSVQSPAVGEPPEEGKVAGSSEIIRTKPDGPSLNSTAKAPAAEIPILQNAPEFQVMDAAGYSTNLQDYRGRVLLIGIWSSDQPESAENLQQLYQTFGARPELRILGVSRRNQERVAHTTFPSFFNNGSRLFEARDSEYVIVDKEGKVQLRGELTGDSKAIAAKIKAKLDQISAAR